MKAVFSDHEHNVQPSHVDGIDYFVTGAGGKVRDGVPNRFAEAHTRSWSNQRHFLLRQIVGGRTRVEAVAELAAPGAELVEIERRDADEQPTVEPMAVTSGSYDI